MAAAEKKSAPRRVLVPRWLAEPIAAQITQGITPEKISLSLALGSLCAFFPILGVATPLCLLAGFALRLNQPVIQLVNAVTAPLYPLVVLGLESARGRLLGAPAGALALGPRVAWLRHDPAEFLRRFAPLSGQAVLGWAVVAPFWIGASATCFLLPVPARRRRGGAQLRAPVRSP